MTEQNDDSSQFEIILNMNIQKEKKNYLFLIVYNKEKDSVIIFIQHSFYIYANEYYLEDLKKVNIIYNFYNNLNNSVKFNSYLFTDLKKSKKELLYENNKKNIY